MLSSLCLRVIVIGLEWNILICIMKYVYHYIYSLMKILLASSTSESGGSFQV